METDRVVNSSMLAEGQFRPKDYITDYLPDKPRAVVEQKQTEEDRVVGNIIMNGEVPHPLRIWPRVRRALTNHPALAAAATVGAGIIAGSRRNR